MSRLIGAIVLLLLIYLPTLQNGVDKNYVTVEGVFNVYPQWYLSKQVLLVCFYNRKVFSVSVIMDRVLLSNPAEIKDVGDGNLIKPYRPIAFYSGFLRDAALSGITLDHDAYPPGVAYIPYHPGFT